ncbi:MAG: DNA mismatch repair endonuclease MutL [Thermodesulfovibrionales bacterium]
MSCEIDLSIDEVLKCLMPQIKVLPVELRNKIAAGEVIERPASIVKELIENSIDAVSTEIKIEVLRGGKGLIKVTDNGIGMDREDALLCLERHATSKLRNEEDLFNIKTMGFRGEALPSIASVSKMRLITGPRNSPSGVSIEVHGGEVKEMRDSPFRGTSIEVRDIFFNTPARRKFLKSDSTELFHIIDSVTKEALSHWDIGFRLFTENQETMSLPVASGPRERIMRIYGLEFIEGLLKINSDGYGLNMIAFVSKGDNFRNSRTHQFIFINRRPIKDKSISHSVYMAYEGILPKDKHPVFFLFIDIDPKRVDFNVHPTKREVRFENKDEIHRFVSSSLREAIREERARYIEPFAAHMPHLILDTRYTMHDARPGATIRDYASEGVSENIELQYQSFSSLYLGDTFIAVAGKGGLTLLDHHAAHERVLYENLLKGINLNSHQLLFPWQVRLSHKEYLVILDNKHLLHGMGIEIDDFGRDTLIVRSLPDALKESDIRGILSDVAASLIGGTGSGKSLKESIAARIACHSSVRGKEILGQEELQKLILDLGNTECPDQCPHGRPTRVFFSLDDLKKMFKRK